MVSQSNLVYIADTLAITFPEYAKRLIRAVKAAGKEIGTIPNTKDVWCEDYMPIKNAKGDLVLFRYFPSYLRFKKYQNKITDAGLICNQLGIAYTRSDIIIDGGNVMLHKNRAIVTERIFKDNEGTYAKKELIIALSQALQAELIIIPTQPYDFTGHSDGMVRWLNDDTVLINAYPQEENQRFVRKFKGVLAEANLNFIEVPTSMYSNPSKEDAAGNYLNYHEMDDCLFLPIYNRKADDEVIALFTQLFPGKRIIPVLSRDVAARGGMINCTTW
jgi:agmatine deiminase